VYRLHDVVVQLIALLDIQLERGHVYTRLFAEQFAQHIVCMAGGGERLNGVSRAEHPLDIHVRDI
jgi:hypothetical protein